jgi:micrococcal nuclease
MKSSSAVTRWILYGAFVLAVALLVFVLYPSFRGIRVSEVTDGDTVLLNNGKVIRYVGVDAPEEGEPFYQEATQANYELLQGGGLTLEYDIDKQDRYGRVLAYVWMDTLLVNAELVRRGMASVYTFSPNLKYRDRLVLLQKGAREAKKGIWSMEVPEEEYYVASNRAKRFVFHRPDCQWARRIKEENLIRFETRAEALDSGYSRCRTCKP